MADPRLDGLRVVVVEDHDDTVELVQQAVRHLGATVTAVSRAREAVALGKLG